MYVTACVEDGGGQRKRERKGVEEEEREKGRLCNCVGLSATVLVCLQKMVWLDDKEERKRTLVDLRVMTSHRSPYILLWLHHMECACNVSCVWWSVCCECAVCVNVCALSVLGAVCHVSKWSSEQ